MADRKVPAIPTRFDGVLYRGRTEARWAVFFKELGIPFEYEAQGFDADGTWYLPDFLLFPALGMLWAEVKGAWQADPDGVAKWRKFSAWLPLKSRTTLLSGGPMPECGHMVIGGSFDGAPRDGPWEDEHQWRPCPSGHHFDLAFPGPFGTRPAEDGCETCANDGERRLERAFATSRSYRFGTGG